MMNKSRKVGWVRHIARMGEMKIVYRMLIGKFERWHLEDLGMKHRMLLTLILKGTLWDAVQWIYQDRQWSFGCHKRRRIHWLGEWLLSSWETLCHMQLVKRLNAFISSPSFYLTLYLYSSSLYFWFYLWPVHSGCVICHCEVIQRSVTDDFRYCH
jgi:hypothetical protein